MKKTFIFLAAAMFAAVACSVEKAEEIKTPEAAVTIPEGYVPMSISASMDPATKTTLDGKTVSWAAGDKIKVVWAEGSAESEALTAGGADAVFNVLVPAEVTEFYAVYPSIIEATVDGESFKVTVPASQDGTFAGANVMAAKIDGCCAAFKNVCKLVKFTTEKADVTRAQLCALDSRSIAGPVAVKVDSLGTMSFTPAATNAIVSLDGLNGAGTYYVATLPDSTAWTGFGLRIGDNDSYLPGIVGSKPFANNDRGTITNLGTIDDKIFEGEYNFTASDVAILKDLLAQDQTSAVSKIGIAKAWRIAGKTINLAEGTYDFGETVKVEFNGYGAAVPIIIKGTNVVIDGGGRTARALVFGNNSEVAFSGITFQNANPVADGGCIQIAAGQENATLQFTNCKFQNNNVGTTKSGAAICVGKGSLTLENCSFTGNYSRNGASIYSNSSSAKVIANNCTFKVEHTSNTGGAVNNSGGKQSFTNCTFEKCYTEGGTGGAIHSNSASSVVTLKNCTFKECESQRNNPYSTKDSADCGGAISMQESYLYADDCVFDGCMGMRGSFLLLQKGSGLACLNNCEIKNCKGASRGLIELAGSATTLFMNNCRIHDNYMRTGDWGRIVHGGNPSVVCMNNCTLCNNTSGAQNAIRTVCLNSDGSTIVVNSTVIDNTTFSLVRNTNATADVLLANSILINVASTGLVLKNGALACQGKTYNCYLGSSCDSPNWTGSNDKTEITSLDGGSFSASDYAYYWNGPDSDFVKTTPADVKALLDAMTRNNGNTRVNGAFGPKFAAWVAEKGGFEKDMLGTTRTAIGTWPGAIEVK